MRLSAAKAGGAIECAASPSRPRRVAAARACRTLRRGCVALAGLRALRTTLDVLHERGAAQTTAGLSHVLLSQLSAEQIARRDN